MSLGSVEGRSGSVEWMEWLVAELASAVGWQAAGLRAVGSLVAAGEVEAVLESTELAAELESAG